jgi:pSer/pThr/pTyr-binding forkhead associated (FHA) protein
MIKCSECGYENIDGLDYCDGCGAKLNAAAAAPAGDGGGAAAEPPPAEPAAASAEAPPSERPPSEAPTGEIKPPPQAAAEAPSEPPPAQPEAPVAAARFRVKVQIIRGGRKGHEFPLEDGNNLVGRWDPETGAFPEVDLDQDDPEAKISRKHALIRIENGKITVEDIGSLNGTYVNRQPRLMPGNPVELKSGDEIIIGKTFLKLMVEPVS